MKCNKNILRVFFLLIFLSFFLPLALAEGSMNNYCITPPFLAQSIPPNVLIVMDNSLSMGCDAYAGSYDPTQFVSGNYYGYFEPTANYKYNGSRWEKTIDAMITGTVANPIASGNFLNWATMRRVEVTKKLLIGGKANPRSWNGSVTVKLDGESGLSYCQSYNKDFDNTTVPNIIYPFTGNYRYTRNQGSLSITPLVAGADTETLRPNSDVANGAWAPNSGATRWTQVDEATADADTTYIENTTSNTNDHVILGYRPYTPTIAGTITNVTIVVRAKKTASGTMRIQGVLRLKTAGVDLDSVSSYSNLSTSYSNYNFNWATNPQTGVAWTFADLTGNAVGSLSGFGVKAYSSPSASNHPHVTQIYMIVTVSNPSGGPYSVIVDMGPGEDATGIIDTLTDDVKFGLAYYASSDNGGKVAIDVAFGTPTNMITSISNMSPETYTPLGETLYEMIRYFRQDSPYYGNSPADYQTGLNYDPYYYNFTDASLTDMYVPCAKSFILFLTDGESTMDQSMPGTSTTSPYAECSLTNIKACSGHTPSGYTPSGLLADPRFAGTSVGTSYTLSGTDYIIDAAFWGRTTDARPGACTTVPTVFDQCLPGIQNIFLYSVFMFGSGSTLLKDAAIYGGFDDLDNDNIPDCNTVPEECYRDSDTDGTVESNGDDKPTTYYEGNDGYELEDSILEAIAAILKRASSGTAASVLASGEGSGANLIQAIFYPKKIFELVSEEIDWVGTLQNYWYYLDPRLGNSSIREDTINDNKLVLNEDYIASMFFDPADQRAKAYLSHDTDGDGTPEHTEPLVYIEELKSLWEAGKKLWGMTPASRTIRTSCSINASGCIGSTGLMDFSISNFGTAALRGYLQAVDAAEAEAIIRYTRGEDTPFSPAIAGFSSTYRSRSVTLSGTTNVWKLGDIINSTPKIASWIRLNNYDKAYSDDTYASFLETNTYKRRGTVFAGGNDGMLHAFKLGLLHLVEDVTFTKAILCNDANSNGDCDLPGEIDAANRAELGKEQWAFVPNSALPYLKYLADPNYCHLYYADLTPTVFDASVEIPAACTETTDYWKCAKSVESWRTILIAGMKLGGACKDTTYAGSYGVTIPAANMGYSSYFALDVTDPTNPTLLWEFTDPALGFSTSGPALIRINARTTPGAGNPSSPNRTQNGRWFVVFASGPTGPIDLTGHQFMGYSDQSLKLFVLDLKTGQLLRTIDTADASVPAGNRVYNAFGGSMWNATFDFDFDYQDDVMYIGYTAKCPTTTPGCATTTWTQGGVIRLITREDLTGDNIDPSAGNTALNPANWKWSHVAKDIGPVTSSVGHIAHYEHYETGTTVQPDAAYLFFGTGRYFFKTATVDDASSQRALFGLKEPCLSKMLNIDETTDPVCDDTTTVCSGRIACDSNSPTGDLVDTGTHGCIGNATSDFTDCPDGWYINLDLPVGSYLSERVITDPLATPIGAVFFTTYAPNTDICTYGGSSYLWAVKYDTGGSVEDYLHGKALLQVSTGAIEEVNLEDAFTEKEDSTGKHRRTGAIQGVPPTGQGLALVVPPQPINRLLHIRKK